MKNKKILIVASICVFALIFFFANHFYKANERKVLSFMAKENASTFVRDYSPSMGSDNASVYLVEFLDPECEACSAFYLYVKKLVEQYDGEVKHVVRYSPFHQNSVFVVKLLEAARKQGKFWETLELVFNYQPQWASHHDPKPDLLWTYLPQIGLDIERVKKDIEDPQIAKNLEQDIQDGKALNVKATPTFFINGRQLELLDFESLRKEIEIELKK